MTAIHSYLLKTKIWFEYALAMSGKKNAKELELTVFAHKKSPSGSYARWERGTTEARQSSADRLNNAVPQARELYELPLWDLIDERIDSIKKLHERNIRERISKTIENPMQYIFLKALYDLRIAEYSGDPDTHFKKMEEALRLCPFYLSMHYFPNHFEKLVFFLYKLSWAFETTESRIMPDHDLLYFYIENIDKYDYQNSERPVIYIPNFMDYFTEETFYKMKNDKSSYKFY